jgi:protein tyrosine phosphatase (PTP) superfamily phosphohydrolase (DUF442 family)
MEKIGFDEGAAVKQAGMEYVTVPLGAQAPTGEDLEKIAKEIIVQPPEVIERVKKMLGS